MAARASTNAEPGPSAAADAGPGPRQPQHEPPRQAPQSPRPTAAPPPEGAPGAGRRAPLLQTVRDLWRELPGLLSDRIDLLSLELHRAGMALVQIVILVVALGILGITAWLLLWAGIVAGLVALGLHVALAMGLALILNVIAAGLALGRVRLLLRQLRLPATRRHLTLAPKAAMPSATHAPATPPPRPPQEPPDATGQPVVP